MDKLKPCPACASDDIDPAGHAITITMPEGTLIGGAVHSTTGPKCLTCGFWSARGDWSPAQNIAGWNTMGRYGA